MFLLKKKYYLFIENTRDFDLNLIKKRNKFNIIYRNQKIKEKESDIKYFRNNCKKKGILFYIANNIQLLIKLKADGLYISSHNRNLLLNCFSKLGFIMIGSAHNYKEIEVKKKQGCTDIIYSRLFETSYENKKGHLGLLKFNALVRKTSVKLIPLGGIKAENMMKMNIVKCNSFACLSAVKKKPAKIINRLF